MKSKIFIFICLANLCAAKAQHRYVLRLNLLECQGQSAKISQLATVFTKNSRVLNVEVAAFSARNALQMLSQVDARINWSEKPFQISVNRTDLVKSAPRGSSFCIIEAGDTLTSWALADLDPELLDTLLSHSHDSQMISEKKIDKTLDKLLNPIGQYYYPWGNDRVFYNNYYRSLLVVSGARIISSMNYLDSFQKLTGLGKGIKGFYIYNPFFRGDVMYVYIEVLADGKQFYLGQIRSDDLNSLCKVEQLKVDPEKYPLLNQSYYVDSNQIYASVLQYANDSLLKAQGNKFRILGTCSREDGYLVFSGFTQDSIPTYFVEKGLGIRNSFVLFPVTASSGFAYSYQYYPEFHSEEVAVMYDTTYLSELDLNHYQSEFRPYQTLAIHRNGSIMQLVVQVKNKDYLIKYCGDRMFYRKKLGRHSDLVRFSLGAKRLFVFKGALLGRSKYSEVEI